MYTANIFEAICIILGRTPDWLSEVQITDYHNGEGLHITCWNAPENRPTDEQLQQAITIVETKPSAEHVWDGSTWVIPPDLYQEKRRVAYPPIGDQLDALWKHLSEQNLAPDSPAGTMLSAIQAVKTQFPKP